MNETETKCIGCDETEDLGYTKNAECRICVACANKLGMEASLDVIPGRRWRWNGPLAGRSVVLH